MTQSPCARRPLVLGGIVLPVAALAALFVAAARPATARAQEARTILVVGVADVSNGAPLPGAEVTIPDLERMAHTNWMGEARIPGVASGVYRVRVRRVGYAAADLQLLLKGDSTGAVFMLRPVPQSLDTVRITAMPFSDARYQFERRRVMGLGRFLTAEDLAAEGTHDFAMVAQQHIPGIQVVIGRGGRLQIASRRSSCGTDTTYEMLPRRNGVAAVPMPDQGQTRTSGAGSGERQNVGESATSPSSCFSDHPCHVKLFLDDLPLAETDMDVVRTEDIYGVEYYSAGNAPPQYQGPGAGCGVMLLWSK